MNKKQSGAALLAALIVLAVMALIAVQMTTQSNVNQALIMNESSRLLTEQHAQNIANMILSDIDHFVNQSKLASVIPSTLESGSYSVSYSTPTCIQSAQVDGYSLNAQIVPQIYHWIFDVTVTDKLTGASTTLNVGAKFNYTAGNCTTGTAT